MIELFSRRDDGLSLSEIAAALHVPVSSAHALLRLLQTRGYLDRSQDGRRYRPGKKLFEVSRRYVEQADPYAAARRLMRKVAEQCGQTVHLSTLAGCDSVYVDGIASRSALGLASRAGMRMPAHTTADGRALLADLPDDVLASLYADAEWPHLSDRTPISLQALQRECEEVRWTGVAHDVGGAERGVHAVAAALPVDYGSPPLALSIAAPTSHLDSDGLRRMLGVLREAVPPSATSPAAPCPCIGWSLATMHVDTYVEFRRVADAVMARHHGTILWTDAHDDADKQAIDVDRLLDQQPCAVLIHPVNAATSDALFSAARRRGVLAVCFQRPTRSRAFDFFVGGDTYREGCMQAHALARALDGHGSVLIIQGDAYNDNARNIAQGNHDALAEYPNITVLESQPSSLWSRESAQDITREVLASDAAGSLRGIVAANDDMAVGVAEVLAEAGLTARVKLVGGDGDAATVELIRRGAMLGTAFQDPALLATTALEDVLRVCAGSLSVAEMPRTNIIYAPAAPLVAVQEIPYTWIDASNLAILESYWAARGETSPAGAARFATHTWERR